jgi:hypothetical protein
MVPSLARIAFAGLLFPAAVAAHGSISKPTVTFKDIYNKNAPAATMSGTPGQYTGSAVIRDLAAQPAPADGKVTFDISAVHVGPCEVWLDDVKAASANDCWATYADKTIPVDYSLCTGASCQLRWVWLATHNDPWEIYDNCVNVDGSSSSGSSTGNSSASTAPTTATPAVTTTATPAATTTAPAPATGSTSDASPGTVAPADTSASGSAACSYRGAGNQTQFDAWCVANCAMNYCPESYCEADCA